MCNNPKTWTIYIHHRVMCPNNADGMANSSFKTSIIWVYTVCIDLSVRKLRNIKVTLFRQINSIRNGN